MLRMLRVLTPARMRMKLKMRVMPKLRLRNNVLPRPVLG
jgi:hypothetical protein